MKKFAVLAALFVLCGCDNRHYNQNIFIPNDQVLASIEADINSKNSVVVIKCEKKETR